MGCSGQYTRQGELLRSHLHNIRSDGLPAAGLIQRFGGENNVGCADRNAFYLKNRWAGIIVVECINCRSQLPPGHFDHFLIVGRSD